MNSILNLFIGAAVFLVWFIMSRSRGDKKPIAAIWISVGFGILAIVISVILEAKILPDSIDQAGELVGQDLMNASLTIGLIEELAKFLPLAIFIYSKKYFRTHNDGIFYFALAGLGFGVPENLLYTMGGGFTVGLMRLIMTPFFHAATTAIVGYFLVRLKVGGATPAAVFVSLVSIIVLHAAYNYGLMVGGVGGVIMSFILTFSLTAILFGLIKVAQRRDLQASEMK